MRPILFRWRGLTVHSYPALLYVGLVLGVFAGNAAAYGALALMLPLSVPVLSLLGLRLGDFWDAATFTILVGMIFTRLGCLLNGCCAGRVVKQWGIRLPNRAGV